MLGCIGDQASYPTGEFLHPDRDWNALRYWFRDYVVYVGYLLILFSLYLCFYGAAPEFGTEEEALALEAASSGGSISASM